MFLVNKYGVLMGFSVWAFFALTFLPYVSLCQVTKQSNCPQSQKQAYVWYFGNFTGIDFNSGQATVVTDNNHLEMLEANACICDSTGLFLLASGGKYELNIFNRQLTKIDLGYDLGGSVTATQSSLFIPRPGSDYLFDVFFLNLPIDYPTFENGLVYFTLNLSNINSPKIEFKPDTLKSKISEGVSSVHHQNGQDVWVVVHDWGSANFLSYLITENGLESTPVISTVGSIRDGDTDNAIGTLKFSPDGNYLAYSNYSGSSIELFKFNSSNGSITFLSSTNQFNQPVYGAAYSLNSKRLYITTMHIDVPNDFESKLYQFDLNSSNPLANPVLIATGQSREMFCGMQLAPDGKIYVARSPEGNENLGVINNPNRPGLECNFNLTDNQQNEGLYLQGRSSSYGLPVFNQSYFNLPNILYDSNCYLDETRFRLLNNTNIDSVKWTIDGYSTSTAFEPLYTFGSDGEYLVEVTEFFNGMAYADSMKIVINPPPEVAINQGKDTLFILSNNPETLDAGAGFATYLWSTGETTQKIESAEEGHYWVEVSNNYCCIKRDSVFLMDARIFIPNAFIPGSSGADRSFNIIDDQEVVDNFELRIYDRWGGLITSITDKSKGWNGSGYSNGVYYYSVIMNLTDGTKLTKTGNVTLIR